MLDLSHEPDLGYIFYPYETPDHPGHPRLDIIIHEKPTNRHFDPQKVQYKVAEPQTISSTSPSTIPGHWRKSIESVPAGLL